MRHPIPGSPAYKERYAQGNNLEGWYAYGKFWGRLNLALLAIPAIGIVLALTIH